MALGEHSDARLPSHVVKMAAYMLIASVILITLLFTLWGYLCPR